MNHGSSFRNVGVFLLFLFLVDESYGQNCGEFNETIVFPLPIVKREEPRAFPWMVEIAMRNQRGIFNHMCTAVLITRRHILSAGHCFNRRDPSLYVARIGNVDFRKAPEYTINRIQVPDTYKKGRYYDDIAVLTLSMDVNSKNASPICLPESIKHVDLTGKGATVAGWKIRNPESPNNELLMEVSPVPIISNAQCEALYSSRLPSFRLYFRKGITNGFHCVGTSNKETCQIGSGSPLMYMHQGHWYVVGLTAFSVYGTTSLPDGYTRVSNYLDWILQKI